jgi:hypothetical protein
MLEGFQLQLAKNLLFCNMLDKQVHGLTMLLDIIRQVKYHYKKFRILTKE